MSKSKEIKGKKASKKNNLVAARKYRKHIPYGALKKASYDTDENIVGIVNKSKERRKNKIDVRSINDLFDDPEQNELIDQFNQQNQENEQD